jgi:phosphatidylglycerophosphate synthase
MASSLDSNARLTIPNLITLTRILLTPLFVIFLIQQRYHQALWIFILAGVSDMADGLIARRWRQKSPLAGKLSTTTQVATVLLVLVAQCWTISSAFLPALFWLTGGITAISGIHYVLHALLNAAHSYNRQG